MRHAKRSFRVGRTTSHVRCLIANAVKSLIEHGRIETTLVKAKEIRRHADKMVTLAKKGTLDSRRRAIGKLMITFNQLEPKEARQAKAGDVSVYNGDRTIIKKLYTELADRYKDRQGGYTRIIRKENRIGDNAQKCIIEFV